MENQETKLILCDCQHPEHQLILMYFTDEQDEDEKFIFAHVHLAERPFLKRIWSAIKYIFGYRCRYGHFDEVLISKRVAGELVDYIGRFITA